MTAAKTERRYLTTIFLCTLIDRLNISWFPALIAIDAYLQNINILLVGWWIAVGNAVVYLVYPYLSENFYDFTKCVRPDRSVFVMIFSGFTLITVSTTLLGLVSLVPSFWTLVFGFYFTNALRNFASSMLLVNNTHIIHMVIKDSHLSTSSKQMLVGAASLGGSVISVTLVLVIYGNTRSVFTSTLACIGVSVLFFGAILHFSPRTNSRSTKSMFSSLIQDRNLIMEKLREKRDMHSTLLDRASASAAVSAHYAVFPVLIMSRFLIDAKYIGIFCSIPLFVYGFCYMILKATESWITASKKTVGIAMFFLGLFMVLEGSDVLYFLDLSNSLDYSMCCIVGVSCSFCIFNNLSERLMYFQTENQGFHLTSTVAFAIESLMTNADALGCVMGPLFGGFIAWTIGIERAFSIYGVILWIFAANRLVSSSTGKLSTVEV